jgi:hypothetical protein
MVWYKDRVLREIYLKRICPDQSISTTVTAWHAVDLPRILRCGSVDWCPWTYFLMCVCGEAILRVVSANGHSN